MAEHLARMQGGERMKQPRVPEYRESENVGKYLKALNLFLKDFCLDTWAASGRAKKRIDGIAYPVTSVNGETGDVQLDAEKIGALSSDPREAGDENPEMGGVTSDGFSLAEVMLRLYPVGAVYMSAHGTSPAELFGGAWERLKDRFLLAAGDSYAVGSAGGEAVHTLTVDEMPDHAHSGRYLFEGQGADYEQWGFRLSGTSRSDPKWPASEEYTGGNQPHNNMPPYLAVYMWKRVS